MSSFGGTIHHEELLWLLGGLSELYRLPFDATLVAQSFPPSYKHAGLHGPSRSLGFKTGTRTTAGLDRQKLPLPAIGFLFPPPKTNPQPAPDSPSTDQSVAEANDPPPCILFVSLTIQLVSLTTPLFTQVIIDKVIAHRSRSILIVLGLTLTMTWLRQYLVLRTSNRIDAGQGSKVFRHLIPGQLKRGIKTLLRKQGQKQQQKKQSKGGIGAAPSNCYELECIA